MHGRNGSTKGISPAEIAKAMAMDEIRNSAKELKSAFIGQMEKNLSEIMDDVIQSMDTVDFTKSFHKSVQFQSDSLKMQDKRKASIAGKLPERVFKKRQSPLTDLFEIRHFRTIHHIFIATLALIMLHTSLVDLLETGTIDLGFERLLWAFGKPQQVLSILFLMHFAAHFVLYPTFYFWATHRFDFKADKRNVIDLITFGGFVSFFIAFIYLPASQLWKNPLPPASSTIVTMEQARLLMKMYAFVRHNIPRALLGRAIPSSSSSTTKETVLVEKEQIINENGEILSTETNLKLRNGFSKPKLLEEEEEKPNPSLILINKEKLLKRQDSWISWDDENSPCPDYSKYLYFLFAPTLIYRDNYPRTNKIRWNYVFLNFLQVLGCIIYANFLLSRFCSTFFAKTSHPDHLMTLTELVHALFSLMLPGIICLVMGFYLLLHCWNNAFAEMLTFGDRLFYKDWWNSSSFSEYYKTWNLLVHDWLYTYVFKDAWEFGLGKIHKTLPTILVFTISSIFHEYILAFAFNFFYPALLILFGVIGLLFSFLKTKASAIGNMLTWAGLIAGIGILLSLYTMEFYARINCPPSSVQTQFWNFITPQSWMCKTVKL